MAHKYVTDKMVADLQNEIAASEASIGKISLIASRTREGIEAALEILKELYDYASKKKDEAIDACSPDSQAHIHYWRGRESMAYTILNLFTKPQEAIDAYKAQREELESRLVEYKNHEQRPR